MAKLYPLRFQPLFRRYLWGGRRLGTVMCQPLPEDAADVAESWHICDRGVDQSVVACGPLAGHTLNEICAQYGPELFGGDRLLPVRFPLLVKLLDARLALSVQVHPNDQQAALLTPPDAGKTEAWIVLAADPGSEVFAGLRPGVDRAGLRNAVADGTVRDCLGRLAPKPGDCLFLPAGTIHALGAGLVVYEVQQSSDTTFRLFDWNRTGPDGRPRPLHVEQALATTDFSRGPVAWQPPRPTDRPHIERLVECGHFVLDRWNFDAPQSIGGDNRFHFVTVLAGAARLSLDAADKPLSLGESALIPAAAGELCVTPVGRCTLVDAYLPG